MAKIPLTLRVQDFQEAKAEWEEARRRYVEAAIIFEAAEKLRRLEEEGPGAFPPASRRKPPRKVRALEETEGRAN
jgi:hypothetical protein